MLKIPCALLQQRIDYQCKNICFATSSETSRKNRNAFYALSAYAPTDIDHYQLMKAC